MVRTEQGFTLVEVIIAVLVLTIGIFGLAKSTAGMIKMLGDGDRAATAAIHAQERLELLRARACSGHTSGSEVRDNAYDLYWEVSPPSGEVAQIDVIVQYRAGRGYRTDTVITAEYCP